MQRTVTVHPAVHLKDDGSVSFVTINNGKRPTDKDGQPEPGSYAPQYGLLSVFLPEFEVTFEQPDDLRKQALRVLHRHRAVLSAQHQRTMTDMQLRENKLLGLAAPEIVDAVTPGTPIRPADADVVDDIPF